MHGKGTVEKVYGGVVSTQQASDTRLLPYEQRHTVLSAEKDAISKKPHPLLRTEM